MCEITTLLFGFIRKYAIFVLSINHKKNDIMNVKMLLADNDKVKKNVAYFNVMDKPSNYKILENAAYIIKVNGCEKAANIVT